MRVFRKCIISFFAENLFLSVETVGSVGFSAHLQL